MVERPEGAGVSQAQFNRAVEQRSCVDVPRSRTWMLLWTAMSVAVGAAICSGPALSQRPNHAPPPPPPRPPVHRAPPPPVRQVTPPVRPQQPQVRPQVQPLPREQHLVPQVQSAPQTPQTPQAPQLQNPGTAAPPVGTRVNPVPHPPVRPWEQVNAGIPPSERPPPGMCRVWLNNVPAGSQPAPTSCSKAIQMHPPNGHVIFGEDGRRPTATRVPPARSSVKPSDSSGPESPFGDH
jgi:hypothetical protein